jgi:hypothetical protein
LERLNGKTDGELLAAVERLRREVEIEAEVEKRLEQELAQRQDEEGRQAEALMLSTKRSQLTPKQKSEIIRSRGKGFYDALPW